MVLNKNTREIRITFHFIIDFVQVFNSLAYCFMTNIKYYSNTINNIIVKPIANLSILLSVKSMFY